MFHACVERRPVTDADPVKNGSVIFSCARRN